MSPQQLGHRWDGYGAGLLGPCHWTPVARSREIPVCTELFVLDGLYAIEIAEVQSDASLNWTVLRRNEPTSDRFPGPHFL
jgi:hypothetical protein